MKLLYNLIIYLYLFGINLATPFNKKARLWVSGRKKIFNRLNSAISKGDKIGWFHCASLGEFEQARPLIESFKHQFPDFKILLTFFSPSGFETRKNYDKADFVFYMPLDTKSNVKRFINIINPNLVFFIKYEYWFNYLSELKKRNIQTYLVSAILRPDQHFFKFYGGWFRKQLNNVSYFFVQNRISLDLLNSIGIKNAVLTGDTRFDRVFNICNESVDFPLVDAFKQNQLLLIGGSTWNEDDEAINEYHRRFPEHKIIIAPHEVHDSRILKLRNKFGKALLFSEANNSNISKHNILIIDSIGILSHLYKYSDITFIGGGFGSGIHNILEAATFGKPIFFGPNYHKFQEAEDLIESGGAFPVKDGKDFVEKVRPLINNKSQLNSSGEVSKSYVENKRGATDKIIAYLNQNTLQES